MEMFKLGTPLWQIMIRTLVVYLTVFIGFRLTGKRELGQMTIFDLVLILLIANAVQNAMVGPDASLEGGLVAAAVLLLVNRAVAEARLRSPMVSRLFEGQPTVLVAHGRLMTGQIRKQGLSEDDLEMAMREHGIKSLADVELAVLETDGSISIVPTTSQTYRSHRARARAIRKKS
jgi:uncharacterized membrane protein YcaP (DUF421 family)